MKKIIEINIDLKKNKTIFDFLKLIESLGFKYDRLNYNSVHRGRKKIVAHEYKMIRGRFQYHFFVTIYRNKLGNGKNNRIRIFAHTDIFRFSNNKKTLINKKLNHSHYYDSTDFEIKKYMQKIIELVENKRIGKKSYKDKRAKSLTFKVKRSIEIERIFDYFDQNFEKLDEGKYYTEDNLKKTNIWITQQKKYIHIKVISGSLRENGKRHLISKSCANKELKRLKNIEIFQGL